MKGQSEKSQKSSKSSHSKSSKSSQSSSSHKSNSNSTKASCFTILERRKTGDHAKLIANQEEERAYRKFKILEKTLEFEKEKLENEKIEARNKAILAEFETRYDDVSKFPENEYECESKSRTRKSSLREKSIGNNSFNLLESYLKPLNAYPNSDTITSSHDNINTDKQNIDIITASNNDNNLTINESTIKQNRHTNSKNNFNLIPDNKLVDNINQPVVAPNPNQLINIQPAPYNNTQPISSNSEIQTTSNNKQNSINVNNQYSEKDSANIPALNSNHHNQSVRTPTDKHSPLPKTSLITDTSQTLFVEKYPVDKFIDDLVEGVETSFKATSASMNLQLALQQEYEIRHLPAIESIRFDGSPSKWPEFIDSFHQNIHSKVTFTGNIRMMRLISLLDGDTKKAVQSIGSNRLFYASALKSLKINFGNPLFITIFRMKTLFDKAHINGRDRIALKEYQQRLKMNNT